MLKKFQFKNFIINPFFLYGITFLFALILYPLRWVQYPQIDMKLIGFLLFSVLFSVILGFFYNRRIQVSEYQINQNLFLKLFTIASIPVSIGFFLTFFIARQIPLFEILFPIEQYDYRTSFDQILYLTTFSLSLNGAVFLMSFFCFLKTRIKIFLLFTFLSLVWIVLYGSRAYAVVVFLPSFILSIYMIRLTKARMTVVILFLVIFIFAFGYYGDKRETAKEGVSTTLHQKLLSSAYPEWMPKEFIWGYFYFTSPIAKLQYLTEDPKIINDKINYYAFIFEFLPKSISKRIDTDFEDYTCDSDYGFPSYYVSTAFGDSYKLVKWNGIFVYLIILFGFLFILGSLSLKWFPFASIPLSAVLSTFAILSVFDNMLKYSMLNFIIYSVFILSISYFLLLRTERYKFNE